MVILGGWPCSRSTPRPCCPSGRTSRTRAGSWWRGTNHIYCYYYVLYYYYYLSLTIINSYYYYYWLFFLLLLVALLARNADLVGETEEERIRRLAVMDAARRAEALMIML